MCSSAACGAKDGINYGPGLWCTGGRNSHPNLAVSARRRPGFSLVGTAQIVSCFGSRRSWVQIPPSRLSSAIRAGQRSVADRLGAAPGQTCRRHPGLWCCTALGHTLTFDYRCAAAPPARVSRPFELVRGALTAADRDQVRITARVRIEAAGSVACPMGLPGGRDSPVGRRGHGLARPPAEP